jgi:hypothetical protein
LKLIKEETTRTYEIYLAEAFEFTDIAAVVKTTMDTMVGWSLVEYKMDMESFSLKLVVKKSKGL